RIPGRSGLGHVFSGLLRATPDTRPVPTTAPRRPVELRPRQSRGASRAAEGAPAPRAGAGAARAAHLHRICQTIETLLSDPDLTLGQVANEDGISPRYLQKLFASAGQSFSSYLRTRRLERCRLDLTSPMCAGLSISEICFRWGFNGSAHFSRAFKDQYGVSPREYRRASLAGG
ncbi:MAG: helix-turn-helix domain-containing protein, partial [Caulobacteraceae bacterium]|nr:helix-turn-helix domain-containing protein [Caulobacteraceae bacterium]